MSKGTPTAGKSVKATGAPISLMAHDVLEMEGHVWSVTGVFPGALHQESVVGLRVEGVRHDATAYGKVVAELFVPEIVIRRGVTAGLIVHHAAAQDFLLARRPTTASD